MDIEHLVAILDDPHGICTLAFAAVVDIVKRSEGNVGPMNQILQKVESYGNRYFLPEGYEDED